MANATQTHTKLVITGASGFLGQQLVPRLMQAGCELVLVGRKPQEFAKQFPDCIACDYDQWTEHAQDFDALLNLAVVNNNRDSAPSELQNVNVELPCDMARELPSLNISTFIQISSVHALDLANRSSYAQSKREADQRLGQFTDVQVHTLYLPSVWGDGWAGALKPLNRLPSPLAKALFRPISALKPTVHIDRVAEAILASTHSPTEKRIIYDDIGKNSWYQSLSRLMDYGFALGVLVFFWWALLLIALWVKNTSPGPGLFAQQRIGYQGKPFTCYKFRTMQAGTVQAGTHEVSAAAVTPVGAFLRRTKLDELPQIWNILRGELRLVGPRPGLPVQQELFNARNAAGVFNIKPGITGWAQIHDVDMSDPQKLARWDAQYIAMRGLLLDLRIIIATATGRGQGDRTNPGESKS